MNTSLNILELKCFIMDCQKGNNSLSYEHLGTNDKIQLWTFCFSTRIFTRNNVQSFGSPEFLPKTVCSVTRSRHPEFDPDVFPEKIRHDLKRKNPRQTDLSHDAPTSIVFSRENF